MFARHLQKRPSEDEICLDYLTKAAFKADETLLSRQCFLDRIGKAKNLDKALVKSIVEIYTNKIGSTVNKEESVFEEAPSKERPELVCYEEPICCKEAAAPINYDKPASCKEVSCREACCGEALCGEASREEVTEAAMRDKTFPPFLLEKPGRGYIYVRTKKGKKRKSKNSKAKRFQDAAEPRSRACCPA